MSLVAQLPTEKPTDIQSSETRCESGQHLPFLLPRAHTRAVPLPDRVKIL